MPRPKKDSGMLTGRERIKDAFWQMYLERPLDKIGIKEVAAIAGCNRTTFYYHYATLESVLEEIETDVILTGGPEFLVNIMKRDGNLCELLNYVEENESKIHKICHLLSSKGDPAFARKMKTAMLEEWQRVLIPQGGVLPNEIRIMLEYFMGGSLSLMGSLSDDPEYDITEMLETLFEVLSRDMFQALKQVLMEYSLPIDIDRL